MDKDSQTANLNTNTFGVPVTSKPAPVIPGILPMQQVLHHNAKLIPAKRSTLARVMITLVSIILLLPGAFLLYVAYLAFIETGIGATIIPAVLGLIFLGGGLSGIVSGVRG
jgi:hypothetical protein